MIDYDKLARAIARGIAVAVIVLSLLWLALMVMLDMLLEATR